MKKISIIAIIILFATACKKEEIALTNPGLDVPEFVGNFNRTYKIVGSNFIATYKIDTNKIEYSNEGNGPGNASYTILFDSYNETDKRWIGHTEDFKYYLIFFKNITATSIDLYKQKVSDPNEAQNTPIPADDNDKNYGWNTYYKI